MRRKEKPEWIHGIRLASIVFVRPQPSKTPFGAAPQTPQMPAEVTA